MNCPICARAQQPFGVTKALGKHNVEYRRCIHCGFIQTEEPYWLDEAYSDAITRSDIGLAGRSINSARLTSTVIERFFDTKGRFLDFGGGYGLMVRLMRDAGFDYYREDKFCANLFAQGFDLDNLAAEERQFELLTAFEVFEHLVQPVAEVETMLQHSRNILFSTELLPEPAPQLGKWWYFGLEHGQHVSLYTRRALTILGGQFGLRLYSDNRSLHLLTETNLPEQQVQLTFRYGTLIAPIMARLTRRPSLLPQDFLALTGQSLQ